MAGGDTDSGVERGELLLSAAEMLLIGAPDERASIRAELRKTLGDAGFVDTCAIIASFNAVVKIADATGIPLENYKEAATRDIRAQLAIDRLSNH